MRFTESLRIEAAAKMMAPTLGSMNGMALRAETKPASLPTKLRYLSAFTPGASCQRMHGSNCICRALDA